MRASLLVGVLAATLGGAVAVASPQAQPAQPSAQMTERPEAADVFFATDSAELATPAKDALSRLAKWGHCHTKQPILIEAHADLRGTPDHNADLATDRARAVRDSLIAQGVRPAQVVVVIYGETESSKDTLSYDRRVTARLANEGELGG